MSSGGDIATRRVLWATPALIKKALLERLCQEHPVSFCMVNEGFTFIFFHFSLILM